MAEPQALAALPSHPSFEVATATGPVDIRGPRHSLKSRKDYKRWPNDT
jgi:hypothetical protein